MQYLKNFQNFCVNENLDLFMMPVDPLKSLPDLYGNTFNELKKIFNLNYTEIVKKLESFLPKFISANESKIFLNNAMNFFGKNVEDLSLDEVKKIIETKSRKSPDIIKILNESMQPGQAEPLSTTQPRQRDSNQRGYEQDLAIDEPQKSSDVSMKIIKILCSIFGANLLTFGHLGSIIVSIFGAMISPMTSIIISVVALVVTIMVPLLIRYSLRNK